MAAWHSQELRINTCILSQPPKMTTKEQCLLRISDSADLLIAFNSVSYMPLQLFYVCPVNSTTKSRDDFLSLIKPVWDRLEWLLKLFNPGDKTTCKFPTHDLKSFKKSATDIYRSFKVLNVHYQKVKPNFFNIPTLNKYLMQQGKPFQSSNFAYKTQLTRPASKMTEKGLKSFQIAWNVFSWETLEKSWKKDILKNRKIVGILLNYP